MLKLGVFAFIVFLFGGIANARILFQHFGGATVVVQSVWVSPLGALIVYPTGSAMGAIP